MNRNSYLALIGLVLLAALVATWASPSQGESDSGAGPRPPQESVDGSEVEAIVEGLWPSQGDGSRAEVLDSIDAGAEGDSSNSSTLSAANAPIRRFSLRSSFDRPVAGASVTLWPRVNGDDGEARANNSTVIRLVSSLEGLTPAVSLVSGVWWVRAGPSAEPQSIEVHPGGENLVHMTLEGLPRIDARVVNEVGRAVPFAEVFSVQRRGLNSQANSLGLADALGEFRVCLGFRALDLAASGPGLAIGPSVSTPVAEGRYELELQTGPPGAQLEAQAFLGSGEPARYARFHVRSEDSKPATQLSGVADGEGRWSATLAEDAAQPSVWRIEVTGSDRSSAVCSASCDWSASDGPLSLTLSPSPEIQVQVSDKAGLPVRLAAVEVEDRLGSNNQETLTDEAGRARLLLLGSGPWRAKIRANGFVEAALEGIGLESGPLRVELQASPTGVILGWVFDERGQAVVDWRLFLSPVDGAEGRGRYSTTAVDGSFKFGELVDTGVYQLSVLDPASGRPAIEPIQVRPNRSPVQLTLPEPQSIYSISGKVLNPDGQELSGASIQFDKASGSTSADGRFELSVALSGSQGELLVVHPLYGRQAFEVDLSSPGPWELGELRLSEVGSLSVHFEGLHVLEGALIKSAKLLSESPPTKMSILLPGGATGTWKSGPLLAGSYRVRVSTEYGVHAEVEASVVAGEATECYVTPVGADEAE